LLEASKRKYSVQVKRIVCAGTGMAGLWHGDDTTFRRDPAGADERHMRGGRF